MASPETGHATLHTNRYTPDGDATVEARIGHDQQLIAAAVTDLVPAPHFHALVLIGGYARGEGGFRFVDGRPEPYNDYDYFVVVGGMGQALYVDVIVQKGQMMNASFLDYGFPTFLEMPKIEAIEVETDDPIGPYGAKEAGEGTQLSPAPAIVNAIYDAIGVDFMELPITPEKILDALEAKKKKE